ncbi:MAG: hypothetical protein NXI20_01025 [bacterium]|nr:hypothetical protein [bacterium]
MIESGGGEVEDGMISKNLFLLAIFLFLTGCSEPLYQVYKQRNSDIGEYPFQVVFAENAKSSITFNELDTLEKVYYQDIIQLNQGHLILVHFTGKFLEFEGDTTVDVGLINNILIENLPKKLRWNRPNIRDLYLDYDISYVVLDGCTDVSLVVLNTGVENKIRSSHNCCVRWIPYSDYEIDTFLIEIKNVFDESIDEIMTTNNELAIDFSNYENESRLYILRVSDKLNIERTSNYFAVNIEDLPFESGQIECQFTSAVAALEYGFMAEHNHCVDFSDAEQFYKTAASLSEKEIYSYLYQRFKKRHGIRD